MDAPNCPADPAIADGRIRSLDPAHIRVETTGWWIIVAVAAVVGMAGLGILLLAIGPSWVWLAALGAWLAVIASLAVGALRWPSVAWRHASFSVHPRGIELRHGVFWRRTVSVPRSRIQHVDVVQGPLLRRHGLASLTIHTAGTHDAAVAFHGLAHPTALEVRDFLLANASRDGV